MKTLDLHGIERWDTLFAIEKFITDNFDSLPVQVITGNSSYNVSKVKEIVERYNLSCHKDRWVNWGSWIIT